MYTVSMHHTYCTTCHTIKRDEFFIGVDAPFTCQACNTEPLAGVQICPACSKPRDPKLFRYPITLAQARARGYFNHEERPMHATSKVCSYCRKKPPSKAERKKLIEAGDTARLGLARHLTVEDLPTVRLSQLHTELGRGRIRRPLVEAEIRRREEQRERIRYEAGVRGAAKRWERHDDLRWNWVVQEITREAQRVANKYSYTKHAALEGDSAAHARWKFFNTYRRTLRAARKQARMGLGPATNDTYTWGQLVKPARMAVLLARWEAIDHVGTVKRRRGRPAEVPMLILLKDIDVFKHMARRPKPGWGLDDRTADDKEVRLRECPVGKSERTKLPVKPKDEPFQHYVHKVRTDTSWDA
jgi:hypothetical protein